MSNEDMAIWYLEQLPFDPYKFQAEAIEKWFMGQHGLLVSAPTGMGKTLIAEAGLYEALKTGKRAYYTTPLIALTEQKYREIQASAERWGFSKNDVGLITGNRKENDKAPILVAVAEVLFNRLLASAANGTLEADFDDVIAVVMDEFHNFSDYERGIVWEFTLELLPKHVRTLLISATVGNLGLFKGWLHNATGRNLEVQQSSERKVPLVYQWVADELLTEQLEKMVENELTPALVFCFDRNECWNVADQIRGRDLIDDATKKIIAEQIADIDWSGGAGSKLKQLLIRGVGIHHAGVLPKYRRIVETLFQQKLLSYCICTETLAAGINLPARSVVLPSIMKGPSMARTFLDPSTAHQIFGRAGRPQYDTQGYVFALAHEDDVRILRWRRQYDQIPDDTKDPKLREMKKKLKKKQPTRRTDERYWNEENFVRLTTAEPAALTSRGNVPIRFLAHVLTLNNEIKPLRDLVERRLTKDEATKNSQLKNFDTTLLTLHRHGFVTLEPEPPTEVLSTTPIAANNVQPDTNNSELTEDNSYKPIFARPTPRLETLLQLRGINPLFGLFLARQLDIADMYERVMALESLLEIPTSILHFVRIPNQRDMPPGNLQRERLDKELMELGLASVEELIEKTDEEREEEREDRRHFGGYAEERIFVLKLPEKLQRLFEFNYPGIATKITPVWAVGDIVYDYDSDFNKYITSKGLQRQEGIIFRHLLRMIQLIEEFKPLVEWSDALKPISESLTRCCREIDPMSTEEVIERAVPPNSFQIRIR
ncbi:MAG: DEAD/DEAH box helicase [Planctomycetaceae bacterium]|jgi:superfamily II DNA/RNA helicase|nr:DEAD/DEAH box helicase [Planctomycetaceae bacterium]